MARRRPKLTPQQNRDLKQVEGKRAAAMRDIQRLLLPDMDKVLTSAQLCEEVASRMAGLPAGRQVQMRCKIAIAAQKFRGLISTMQTEMDGVAQKLRKANKHTQAAVAYGRWGRNGSR